MQNGCLLPWQHHIGQSNEVYSGYILYVCSHGVWELHRAYAIILNYD